MKDDENAHHQNGAQTRIPMNQMSQSAQSGRQNGAQNYDENSFKDKYTYNIFILILFP